MTSDEIAAFKAIFISFGAGALMSAGVAYLLVKFFLSSYFSEKGKNLATREDIAEITRKVEGVRTEYASLVEELKARHQLRLAAVDRRLQTHQDAFELWRKIMKALHTEEISQVTIQCQRWWEQNCIYLEPPVREAFVVAYIEASHHNPLVKSQVEAHLDRSRLDSITGFPDVLFKAIQLPALSELEAKSLELK
jgi:hypothetical protein